MPLAPQEVNDSSEVAYGDLLLGVEKYLCGMDDIPSDESTSGIFLDANILIKNPSFANPDDVAQLVVDGKITLVPGCEGIIDRYRIIPVRFEETQEIFLLYSPDNGQGTLDSASRFSFDFGDHLRAVAPDISLDQTHLIVCTHSHFGDIKKLIGNPDVAGKFLSVFDSTDDKRINELVESVIAALRKLGASDFHVKPGLTSALLQMRLHGLLQPIPGSAKRVTLEVAVKIANVLAQNGGKRVIVGKPLDASFRYVSPDKLQQSNEGAGGLIGTANPNLFDTDHRVSIIPTTGGRFSSVVRLLRKPERMQTMAELDYEDTTPFLEAGKIGYGLNIISGPTGSGKSTTLYALLDEIKDPTLNTVTIEDPVEMLRDGIIQSQVNESAGYTIGSALRHFLRHDPDRIMVAETRDEETAQLSVQAANTGHSVFTTLHANSAADCVRRLYKLGIDPIDVSGTVKYLFAQRLVIKLSPENDFVEYYNAAEDLSRMFGVQIEGEVWMRRDLQPEGVVGRMPIYERIQMTPELRDLIETFGKQISSTKIEEVALKNGFVPMEIYGLRQALLGKTSLQGLTRYIDEGRMGKFRDLALPAIQELGIREKPAQSTV